MGSTRMPNLNSNTISGFFKHSIIFDKNFWIFYFSIFLLKKIFYQLIQDFLPNFKFKHNIVLNQFIVNKHNSFFFLGELNTFKFQRWYFVKIFYFKKALQLKIAQKINFFLHFKYKKCTVNYKFIF